MGYPIYLKKFLPLSVVVFFVLLLQSLISSGTHIIAKAVVKDIDPFTLTMLRSAIATVILAAVMLVRKQPLAIEPRHFRSMLTLSIVAIPVNQFLFLTAMRYTTPSNAALLYSMTPVIVLLIVSFSRKERLSKTKAAGILIAFGGALSIIFEHGIDFHSEYTFGNILLALAVISWAWYTVAGRPMVLRYGAFPTIAMTIMLGTVVYTPIGITQTLRFNYAAISWAHWGGVLYLSVGTSVVSYYLWYFALGRTEASKVAIFTYLQPVLTTLLAVILLGQSISATFVIGGLIAVAGVVLAQFG